VNQGSDTYPSRCQRGLERRPEDPRHRRAQSLGLRTERQNRNRRDDPDKKPEVQIEEQSLGALPDIITVRPFSVNIYSYQVQ
jgi:hypothetical protein